MGYKHQPMRSKFSNFTPFLLSVLVVTTVASCAFREDDVEEEKRKTTEQVAEYFDKRAEAAKVNESNVKYDIKPNPDIGYYDIIVSWPEDIPGVNIQFKDERSIFPEGNSYTYTAKAGELVKVYIIALNQHKNPVDNFEFVVKTPNDLVVDQVMYISSINTSNRINRIKFLPAGMLVVGLDKADLKADYIEVDDRDPSHENGRFNMPHITSISKNTSTKSDRADHGGTITISAGKIVGDLLINSIGLDGNDGANGADASQAPDPSLNGEEAVYKINRIFGMRGPDGDSPGYCNSKLISPPQAGKQGHVGGSGGNGVDGGNSPLFELNVEDFSDLRVFILHRPGKGGRGGEGGLGGPGGIGASGKIFDDNCKPLKSKDKAPDGARGEKGPKGADGKNGSVRGITGNIPAYLIKNETWGPL